VRGAAGSLGAPRHWARLLLVAPALACFAVAPGASAGDWEIGPQFGATMPMDVAAESFDLGFFGGAAFNHRETRSGQIGFDLLYHYWPGSPSAEARLDEFLGSFLNAFGATELPHTKFSLHCIQTTLHVKVVAPVSGPAVPWIQAGAGSYFMISHLEAFGRGSNDDSWRFGLNASTGLDFAMGGGTKLGVDAGYHNVFWSEPGSSNFSTFTVGAHVLFAQR